MDRLDPYEPLRVGESTSLKLNKTSLSVNGMSISYSKAIGFELSWLLARLGLTRLRSQMTARQGEVGRTQIDRAAADCFLEKVPFY